MSKKFFTRISLFVVVLATLVTATAMTASAAETSDTALPSSYITYTGGANTTVRSKTNTTSVYMYNKSGMTLWVWANGGSKPGNPALYDAGTTIGGHANVMPGQYKVRTLIYEKGYRTAWLNITTATSGVAGNCSGLWSPDSIGSYPSAN